MDLVNCEFCLFLFLQISWFENIKKRQVKAPKIYVRDSGVLHALLGLEGQEIYKHPKLGASWEGFALEQVITSPKIGARHAYYWRTQTGSELDLLVLQGNERTGYEFKYTDYPKLTASMHTSMDNLSLTELKVVVPGDVHFLLHEKVKVIGLNHLVKRI